MIRRRRIARLRRRQRQVDTEEMLSQVRIEAELFRAAAAREADANPDGMARLSNLADLRSWGTSRCFERVEQSTTCSFFFDDSQSI